MTTTQSQLELDDIKRYAGTKYRKYLKNEDSDILHSLANSIENMAREPNIDSSLQYIPSKIREAIMYKSNSQYPQYHFNNAVQSVLVSILNCQSIDTLRKLLERIDPISEENKRIKLFNIELNESHQNRNVTISNLTEQITKLIDQNRELQQQVFRLEQISLEQNKVIERIDEQTR